jgi:hypothetical protein
MIIDNSILWKQADRKRSRFEKYFTSQFKSVLTKQYDDIIARIDAHNYNSDAFLNEITADDIKPTFIKLYQTVGISFARDTYGTHKSRSEESLEDTWNAYMTDYAKTKAGSRIVSITEETKRQVLKYVREVINSGIEQGLGTNEIAAAIRKTLSEQGLDINTWRARMIARTEVVGASNAGAIEGARTLGQPMQKIWITTRDNRTREAHMDVDGQMKDIEDTFDVDGERLDCPGDPAGSADNIINCRCAVAFKVKRL